MTRDVRTRTAIKHLQSLGYTVSPPATLPIGNQTPPPHEGILVDKEASRAAAVASPLKGVKPN